MPELDDRLRQLRSVLAEQAPGDFDDVLARRRRVVRRRVVPAALAAVAAAITAVAVAVPGTRSPHGDTLVTSPTPSATAPATSTPPTASTAPSQSAADARRDHVPPVIARLPLQRRVGVVDSAVTPEGVWAVSRLPVAAAARLGARGIEYGELLLLDSARARIIRAYPLPAVPPQHLLVTSSAVYCVRQGDGGLPWSMLCRVSRSDLSWRARVFSSLDGPLSAPGPGWQLDDAVPPAWFEAIAAGPHGAVLIGGSQGVATVDPMTLAVSATSGCDAAAMRISLGDPVEPATGERDMVLEITNVGATACAMYGRPTVRLYDATGRRLAFAYPTRNARYVGHQAPLPVLLAPGQRAYALVAKYRCDLQARADAAEARVTLPGGTTSTSLSITGRTGVETLSLCPGGPSAAGNQVGVSPVSATLARLLTHG